MTSVCQLWCGRVMRWMDTAPGEDRAQPGEGVNGIAYSQFQ